MNDAYPQGLYTPEEIEAIRAEQRRNADDIRAAVASRFPQEILSPEEQEAARAELRRNNAAALAARTPHSRGLHPKIAEIRARRT